MSADKKKAMDEVAVVLGAPSPKGPSMKEMDGDLDAESGDASGMSSDFEQKAMDLHTLSQSKSSGHDYAVGLHNAIRQYLDDESDSEGDGSDVGAPDSSK